MPTSEPSSQQPSPSFDVSASIQRVKALRQEAARRRERTEVQQSLVAWASKAGFRPAAHHELLIADLEALESGEIDTLLVFMPPGSAKSTYVNMLFPAWYLARNPGRNVITASHGAELAERWGRKTRNLVLQHSQDLGLSLSEDSTAAYRWSTSGGGEYYAVGVGVGIAGFRADLGIIDDPFGSREDAESKRMRDRVWNWYSDDFSTRLKPGSRRVIMHTRWHDDDLAGRIIRQLDKIGRPYRTLTLPAQAELNDPLGRPIGEFLWSDDDYGYGAQLRQRKEECDTRTWASLYQQNPVPDTGDYFQAKWLIPVEPHLVPGADLLRLYGGSDYAVSEGRGDYTVHAVLGLDADGAPWLVDLYRRQASSVDWVGAFCDLVKKWNPIGWAEETGQIRGGVGPFLEAEMTRRRAYVARERFPTKGEKAVRAQSFRGLIASRGLRIPADAPWRAELEAELFRFPAGIHDDIVDALGLVGQLVAQMAAPPRPKAPEPRRQRDWFDEPDEIEAPDWRMA